MAAGSEVAKTPETNAESATADVIPTDDAVDAAGVGTHDDRQTILLPWPT